MNKQQFEEFITQRFRREPNSGRFPVYTLEATGNRRVLLRLQAEDRAIPVQGVWVAHPEVILMFYAELDRLKDAPKITALKKLSLV